MTINKNNHNERSNFLKYVVGLRGLAIIMIVMFHIMPHNFSQGFLGVEIFLVISGFLLFKGWKEGEKFHFLLYSKKKIVRIFPLLTVLSILTLLIFCAIAVNSNGVRLLSRSALCSILGISNIYYSIVYSDYFAANANMNPLLHTWYLSLTIQIYVIWGLGSAILWKTRKIIRLGILTSVAIASFCYDYLPEIQDTFNSFGFNIPVSEDASYYGLVNRMWQVLAGGLVFILPKPQKKHTADIICTVSVTTILWLAYCNTDMGSLTPLVIVCCTVMLLVNLPISYVNKFIEITPLTILGKFSFSVYIMHFPIITLYKQWEGKLPTLNAMFILIPIIGALSYALWFCIEKRKFSFITIFLILSFSVVLSLIGLFNHKLGLKDLLTSNCVVYPAYEKSLNKPHSKTYNGFDENMFIASDGTNAIMYDEGGSTYEPLLSLGCSSIPPEYLLIGDSNAQHLFAGFNNLSSEVSVSGVFLNSITISLWDYYVGPSPKYCWTKDKAEALLKWLKQQPNIHTVFISQLWSLLQKPSHQNWEKVKVNARFEEHAAQLKKFCQEVKSTGKQVVLIDPSPILFSYDGNVQGSTLEFLTRLKRRNSLDENNLPSSLILTKKEYHERYSDVLLLFKKWRKEGFCENLCIEKGIFLDGNFLGYRKGIMKMRDATHITAPTSIEILQVMKDDFTKIIEKGRKQRDSE